MTEQFHVDGYAPGPWNDPGDCDVDLLTGIWGYVRSLRTACDPLRVVEGRIIMRGHTRLWLTAREAQTAIEEELYALATGALPSEL